MELNDDAQKITLLMLATDNLKHIFGRQRLEIVPVRRVRIGRNGLRIAIAHDGLEPGALLLSAIAPQRESGVAATIVKLDPLPDPIWSAAKNHHLAPIGYMSLILGLCEQGRLVRRVEIGRGCGSNSAAQLSMRLYTGRTPSRSRWARTSSSVMPPVIALMAEWTTPELPAATASLISARDMGRSKRKLAQSGIGKPIAFQPPHACPGIAGEAIETHLFFSINYFPQAVRKTTDHIQKFHIDPFDREAISERFCCNQQPIGCCPRQCAFNFRWIRALELAHPVKSTQPNLETTQCFLQAFGKVAADRRHFTDRLHRC